MDFTCCVSISSRTLVSVLQLAFVLLYFLQQRRSHFLLIKQKNRTNLYLGDLFRKIDLFIQIFYL